MSKSFLILLIPIFFYSCTKENESCPEELKLENDILSLEAKSYNPYSPLSSKVVFKNDIGNEVNFAIERNFIQTSTNQISGFCYDAEFYKLYLRGIDIDLFFHIWINDVPKPNPDNLSGEGLSVLYSETPDDIGTINIEDLCIDHSINIKDEKGDGVLGGSTIRIDNVLLNGIEFSDVIINNSGTKPKYEAYYNLEFGLVGFANTESSEIYSFDRFE